MASAQYLEYLQSEQWQTKRQQAFREQGFRCRICTSSKHVQVHHTTYARLGDEHNGDLIVLCEECHKMVHRLGGGYKGFELLTQKNEAKRKKAERRAKRTKWKKKQKPVVAVRPKLFEPKIIIRKAKTLHTEV